MNPPLFAACSETHASTDTLAGCSALLCPTVASLVALHAPPGNPLPGAMVFGTSEPALCVTADPYAPFKPFGPVSDIVVPASSSR